MAHFLLMYELAADYLERRPAFRDAHLQAAWAAVERGDLLLGGALCEPVDQALLLFAGDSAAVAETFAKIDPYVVNGLVASWRVRPWLTVAGVAAASPVRP